jgi:crossover junction endodeoxyribonuclease RuvC
VSRPLAVGGDISLTASGLAWPNGIALTHGRTGLTSVRTPLQERGQAMMSLVVELGGLIAGGGLAGALDTLDGPCWPRVVLLEDFPPGSGPGARIDPERGYLWWSLVNYLGRNGVPVLAVPPSSLKLYACGLGNANKREVWAGVHEWYPQFEIHKTSKSGKILTSPDFDKADAVALVAMGCDLLGEPLVELPAKQRKALDALELPPGVRLP